MNRQDLDKKLSLLTSQLLSEKGYISMIDIFLGLGFLSQKDLESWRMKRIPYLERCIQINLGKVSFIVKTVRKNCINGKLRESSTAYKSWGKGKKKTLRFSKSDDKNIERAYSTHYLRQQTANIED